MFLRTIVPSIWSYIQIRVGCMLATIKKPLFTGLRISSSLINKWKKRLKAVKIELTDGCTMLLSSRSSYLTQRHGISRRLTNGVLEVNFQRRILGICWFHFVTNASVTSQMGDKGQRTIVIRIRRRRLCFWSRAPTTESDTSSLCTNVSPWWTLEQVAD